jgi:hypothetical protein
MSTTTYFRIHTVYRHYQPCSVVGRNHKCQVLHYPGNTENAIAQGYCTDLDAQHGDVLGIYPRRFATCARRHVEWASQTCGDGGPILYRRTRFGSDRVRGEGDSSPTVYHDPSSSHLSIPSRHTPRLGMSLAIRSPRRRHEQVLGEAMDLVGRAPSRCRGRIPESWSSDTD